MNKIAHLHCHSDYSLLDGMCKIPDIFERARELGIEAIGITDHGNLDCYVKALTASKEVGVKYIPGVEIYLVDDSVIDSIRKKEKKIKLDARHICLYAKNFSGLSEMFKIMAKCYKNFYRRPVISLTELSKFNFENIAISTACSRGILSYPDYEDKLRFILEKMTNDLWIEVMPFDFEEQKKINQIAIEVSKKFNLNLLATNDVHYIYKDDILAHDILLCIGTGAKISDKDRFSFSVKTLYLVTREEMEKMFEKQGVLRRKEYETALDNTLIFAERINYNSFQKIDITLDIPDFSRDRFLQLVLKKFRKRKFKSEIYYDQILHELDLILEKNFDKYFWIVYDIINFCRRNNILVGPGRGSVGGSLLAYVLGITNVDPIRFELSFDRFISRHRVDLPDIDLDIEDAKRHILIDYLRKKYGSENVCAISTFIDLGTRAVIRDVSRVLEVDRNRVDEVAKEMETFSFGDVRSTFFTLKEHYETNEKVREFLDSFSEEQKKVFFKLEGVIRTAGIHAAGYIISPGCAINESGRAYLVRRSKDKNVINWDKESAEFMGFIKFDLLGLNTLTIIHNAIEIIKERHGKEIDLTKDVDIEDKNVLLEIFCKANTNGVFQFSTDGMKKLLKKIQPSSFDDLITINALYRPGTLRSGIVEQYIKLKKGEEEPFWFNSDLYYRITKKTFSLIIFQEQLLALLRGIGFSDVESDTIRKICAKSKGEDKMEAYRERFIENAVKNADFSLEMAEKLFETVKHFGSYLFNRAHATEYAMLAFWTAWLKYYYYDEFMQSVLSYSTSDTNSILRELQSKKYEVLNPSIYCSKATEWVVKDKKIFPPLSSIFGIGKRIATYIEEIREKKEFRTKEEFLFLAEKKVINSRVIEILEKAKAFDSNNQQVERVSIDFLSEEQLKRLKALDKRLSNCRKCSLINETKEPIHDVYNTNMIVVGEAPGRVENKLGSPFLGGSGKLLFEKGLLTFGFERKDFSILNVVKCFPSETKTPTPEHVKICSENWLCRQLKIIKPAIVLALGKIAASFFKERPVQITQLSGLYEFNQKWKCYVVYCVHPASVLRNRKENEKLFYSALETFTELVRKIIEEED